MSELISIVIPAYNAGPYIENCLKSVLSQNYPDIEILVVDDGSTDETAEIIDRLRSENPDRIRAFHTVNRGVTLARFEGIRNARGEWIGFVDCDDEIEPDMYERLYENAVKHNADISHCGHRTIVNGGERVHDFYGTARLAVQNRDEGLRDLLEGTFEPSLCTKLFRKYLLTDLLESSALDTSIKYNEDLLMNYYLFRAARSTVYEDFCAYHYLARSSSASRKAFVIERVLDPVKVRKVILEQAEPELESIAEHKYLTTNMEAFANLTVKKGCMAEADKIRKELFDNKDRWKLLSRNEKIKLRLMLFSPGLYHAFYRFYENHFQLKKYE